MPYHKPELSVVIAVYNKQNSLLPVLQALKNSISDDLALQNFEIIFVDDASTDNTPEILDAVVDNIHVVRIVNKQNKGQLKSLENGLIKARGSCIVMTSCDLQNPIEELPILYNKLKNGYDCSIAYRISRNERGLNSLLAEIFWKIISLMFPRFPKGGFDFVAFTEEVKDNLLKRNFNDIFLQLELLRVAHKIYYHPVERKKDLLDNSMWSFKKRIIYATKAIKYFIK